MKDDAADREVDIFCAACEIEPGEERDAFVTEACAGDDGLCAAVQQLLAVQADGEGFFQEGCPTSISADEFSQTLAEHPEVLQVEDMVPPDDEEIGKQIGPYRLIEKIGEGGGGSIYLAEQSTPIRRQVAFKIIKLGMDTKSVIARFEAERQVLAMMEHPHIAKVFNAGTTEKGRPYFVMELVHGTKVTTYCDEHGLDISQRLELFVQICHAIQHAHRKGIIHRDIKPSNILIENRDGVPEPRVIDFGVAKATDGQRLSDDTIFTACEQFIGTPAYMSPEQADLAELDIDIGSDIYSLGVLLYELLTSMTPFDQSELIKSGLSEMRRIVREVEPPRPSVKLSGLPSGELEHIARCHDVEPQRLITLLKGDLDWIVMKALEKDRDRRYRTADGFAEDVQRYLDHEPVLARPPSRRYRFRKLVRRNKGVFASIAAISLTLFAGFGTSSWLFVKEREARQSESRLRAEAEVREKITQAAVLLRRNQPAEADKLVGECEVPVIKPSLEAMDVFRQLGEWNVTQGRWPEAEDRFLKLARAIQVDKSDMTEDATRDLLKVAPVLIATKDFENYHRFIQRNITHFAGTSDPRAAEQVVKSSTIIPLDQQDLEALEPLADLLKQSIHENESPSRGDAAWWTLALASYEYRRGDFNQAAGWARKSLAYQDSSRTRIAMSHTMLAMACAQLHQLEEARANLAQGRTLVRARFPDGLGEIEVSYNASGVWNDWVLAYLLLNEATSLIQE